MNLFHHQSVPHLRSVLVPAVLLLAFEPALLAQQQVIVADTAPMAVELVHHSPMKAGAPLTARLLYPVYVDNRLVIPASSTLQGTIVALKPNKKLRIKARFNADFTPYDTPVVRFNRLIFPNGRSYSISTPNATGGAPILHLTASAPHGKRAFIKAEFDLAKKRAEDEAALVTAPGRLDRLRELIYHQLPYHPQRVQTGTAWTIHLAQPLTLPVYSAPKARPSSAVVNPTAAPPAAHAHKPSMETDVHDVNQPSVQTFSGHRAWLLDAYLMSTISSATSKRGDTFKAYVAQPIYGAHHKLMVPEGAVLIGTVTRAKPARSFGRAGNLRFTFNELRMPGGQTHPVEGSLAAADAARSADLRIDSEGGVSPKKKSGKFIIPLAFSLLAVHGLDDDGSQAESGALASNGFGIVGRIIGIVAGSRELATGIGAYSAAQSIYNRWLARGQNIMFPKDTRIEVVTASAPHRMAMPRASPKHPRMAH